MCYSNLKLEPFSKLSVGKNISFHLDICQFPITQLFIGECMGCCKLPYTFNDPFDMLVIKPNEYDQSLGQWPNSIC